MLYTRFMRLIFLLVFLAGCGSSGEENSNNHGYGFEFDLQGATGLKLRYTPVLQAGSQFAGAEFYESEFQRVEDCTGIQAPAPFVIVVGNLTTGGRYHSGPPLILLLDATWFGHEAIHYLLDHSTGNPDTNHNSPLFNQCAPVIIGI